MFYMASRTMASSSGFKLENIKACSRRFFKDSLRAELFSYLGGLKSIFLFQAPNTSALTDVRGPLLPPAAYWAGWDASGRSAMSSSSSDDSLSDSLLCESACSSSYTYMSESYIGLTFVFFSEEISLTPAMILSLRTSSLRKLSSNLSFALTTLVTVRELLTRRAVSIVVLEILNHEVDLHNE